MSKIFTRKPEVQAQLAPCLLAYKSDGLESCADLIHKNVLTQKIKFPLLEYCAELLVEALGAKDQVLFCDEIERYKTIGGDVLLGKILQIRMDKNFSQSIDKAKEYISQTNSWHACDTIGERVFGVALLKEFDKAFPEIVKISKDESQWVVRSMGAGIHYAIKKGLDKKHIPQLFELLLSMGNNKNKEIKQGVGWAAKTTAKFHPDIIKKYRKEIDDEEKIGAWFRTKVKIGLSRHDYAKRNRSKVNSK